MGYDRWRPRYPQPLIDRILATSPGREVLDVGIGTGIVARQLRDAGAEVVGVEPDLRMAAFARSFGFEVEESRIEDWDPRGRTFDALVAGQTWHWVDPATGAAKARQVLRPEGRIALFWNAGDAPAAVTAAYADAFAKAVPDWPGQIGRTPPPAAQLYTTIADRAADGLRSVGGFSEPERWQDAWQQPYTREEYLAMLPTQGTLTRVPAERVAPVLEAVGAAIDRLGGSFVMEYVTTTVSTTRLTG
ncbi:methyltransferase type 11 [Microlunatus endophyticus]|uniref:Methyltransferase type 11 n=2 Tax=Microlunatus endophyticus TaxID=1716077 RepID=A0A917SBQ5_9ACTN|nr:methyltransferase type 11 [Microlunatus endophyticus]